VLGVFLGSSGEVVQVGEDDGSQIVKDVCHGPLKSCTSIFVLIGWVDLNLVIARESVHKGESLVVGAFVDNLIDERRWKVVFRTCVIEIVKVGANTDSALFFVDGYRVGNP
jgi:hypothetical protein